MNEQKRVLIIDDEADTAVLLPHVLKEASFAVEVASNGMQGLSKATASHFDMIPLDVDIPGINGMQCAEATPGIQICEKHTCHLSCLQCD